MTERKKLGKYTAKRSFEKSPEPAGKKGRRGGKEPVFVIQEHDATNRHFDFRIECDGVLKSWSVPKGLSTDPRDKRLAIPTEDHPLEYADFEGTIPEDEYGGGAVIVWDRGVYENLAEEDGKPVPVAEGLEKGHISVRLEGEKLRGGYALIRKEDTSDSVWFVLKMKDEGADARRNPVSTQPKSVLSGETVEEVSRDKSRERQEGKDE
jgi:DNA ligase D-like protein (predicted 3'-phosphoesterase)